MSTLLKPSAVALCESPAWLHLRRQIIEKAIHFTDHLVFDFRPLLTQASNTDAAGKLMWQLVKPYSPDVLIGPGFGAAPLLFATALAALADGVVLQVLMVRDKRKEHNQKKWVEGNRVTATGKRAVVIDDFMKAGSALPLVLQALKAERMGLGMPFFEARVGVHCGPVVAGVVGAKKFAYDIWGDTVNTAARIEEACEPGKVNVSEVAYWLAKYDFEWLHRGKIAAKNKGQLDMYYVTSMK